MRYKVKGKEIRSTSISDRRSYNLIWTKHKLKYSRMFMGCRYFLDFKRRYVRP